MSNVETFLLPSRFDYSYHRQFSELYAPLVGNDSCTEIILDFSNVNYLDSSALGMMVLLKKKFIEKKTRIKIKNAQNATLEILTIANMQKLFEFIP